MLNYADGTSEPVSEKAVVDALSTEVLSNLESTNAVEEVKISQMAALYELLIKVAIIDADLTAQKKHRFPNLACLKLSAYYKQQGCTVELKLDYDNLDDFGKVFISKVFTETPSQTANALTECGQYTLTHNFPAVLITIMPSGIIRAALLPPIPLIDNLSITLYNLSYKVK